MSEHIPVGPYKSNLTPKPIEILTAIGFSLVLMLLALLRIGWPPVVIVGGSSMVGFVMWLRT